MSKLSATDVAHMKSLRENGDTLAHIASIYNVAPSTVRYHVNEDYHNVKLHHDRLYSRGYKMGKKKDRRTYEILSRGYYAGERR